MTVERTDYTSLQFSTRALPASRRLPALRELFDRSVQLEIEADPDQPVEMEMTLAPGLRRARMLSSLTARMARPASMLADGEDTICLIMKTGGHMAIAQRRQESVPQAGDGVLLVYREPALLQFTESKHQGHPRISPGLRHFLIGSYSSLFESGHGKHRQCNHDQ